MPQEKFLAFKGLKQYDPGMGWASVHNFAQSQDSPQDNASAATIDQAVTASTERDLQAALDNARLEAAHTAAEVLHDPLLGELFDQ